MASALLQDAAFKRIFYGGYIGGYGGKIAKLSNDFKGIWRWCQTNANQSLFALPTPAVRQQEDHAIRRELRRGWP